MYWNSGCYVRAVIPFRGEKYDVESMKKNIDFWISQEVTGICFVESADSREESLQEKDFFKECVQYSSWQRNSGEKTEFFAGVGPYSPKMSIRQVKEVGFDGVILHDNFPPGRKVIYRKNYEHCQEVVKSAPLLKFAAYCSENEVLLMSPEELKELDLQSGNFCGTVYKRKKDIDYLLRIQESCRDDFAIFFEKEKEALQAACQGIDVRGVFSVAGNIFPRVVQEIAELFSKGKFNKAASLTEDIEPLFEFPTFSYEKSVVMKSMMNFLGMPVGECRTLSGKLREKVKDSLREVYRRNDSLFRPLAEFYGTDIEKRLFSDGSFQ